MAPTIPRPAGRRQGHFPGVSKDLDGVLGHRSGRVVKAAAATGSAGASAARRGEERSLAPPVGPAIMMTQSTQGVSNSTRAPTSGACSNALLVGPCRRAVARLVGGPLGDTWSSNWVNRRQVDGTSQNENPRLTGGFSAETEGFEPTPGDLSALCSTVLSSDSANVDLSWVSTPPRNATRFFSRVSHSLCAASDGSRTVRSQPTTRTRDLRSGLNRRSRHRSCRPSDP